MNTEGIMTDPQSVVDRRRSCRKATSRLNELPGMAFIERAEQEDPDEKRTLITTLASLARSAGERRVDASQSSTLHSTLPRPNAGTVGTFHAKSRVGWE